MIHAKEFLDEIFILNKKIDAKQREIDIYNELLFKVNKELMPDRVQTSGGKDIVGDTIAKLVDAKQEINNMINDYIDKLSKARAIIEQITDPKEYDLLHKHYIQNMSWKQIGDDWDNSNTWVHEVKRNAFDSVQKILDEKAI